jgi:hypothetical protein
MSGQRPDGNDSGDGGRRMPARRRSHHLESEMTWNLWRRAIDRLTPILTPPRRRARPRLGVEPLEPREVPATLVGPTTLTYRDADGDNVTVTFSKPILTAGNVNTVFAFDAGSVNGNNAAKQLLEKITLTGVAGAAGTTVTTSATRSLLHGGDGLATLGELVATGLDLGAVVIDGDLGRVLAGDATTATAGLAGLKAQSLGRYGTATGAADLHSVIQGRLGFLTVKSDVKDAFVDVKGGADGDIGPVTIRGSLLGGGQISFGRIVSEGDMGLVIVRGDVVGGTGAHSGEIASGGKMAGVTVGGSLQGGVGTNSGWVHAGNLGPATVGGSLIGGSGEKSGSVHSDDKMTSAFVGGSILGGAGKESGRMFSHHALGAVTVRHDVLGGAGEHSGKIQGDSNVGNVMVGGSLRGSDGSSGGMIDAFDGLGFVTVVGDVAAGSNTIFGAEISGGNGSIAGVMICGSLLGGPNGGGRITSNHDIGPVVIKGSVIGDSGVSSGSIFNSNGGRIASVTIGGSLLAGPGYASGAVSAAGSMGPVKIGGQVRGGDDLYSGRIESGGSIASVTIRGSLVGGAGEDSGRVEAAGSIGPVTIRGSVVGGAGQNSGRVFAGGTLGPVVVAGDVAGGTAFQSGTIASSGAIASVAVGGSLTGGTAGTTGLISAGGDLGPVSVRGSVVGGADFSGMIVGSGKIASLAIGGSLVGGADFAGRVSAGGGIATLTIGGDIRGGSASGTTSLNQSGYVGAKRIGALTVGGSVVSGTDNTSGAFANNGAIRVADDIGTATIKGSLIGNSTNPVIISARGQATPGATGDIAIGALTVFGRAEYARILAGFDQQGVAKNADAQIGAVTVSRDWFASSLVAGALPGGGGKFGDGDDVKMAGAGVKDSATLKSAIQSVTIGGQAFGTLGGTDSFGIVAQMVGAVTVAGTPFATTAGSGNDQFTIAMTGDVTVHEVT